MYKAAEMEARDSELYRSLKEVITMAPDAGGMVRLVLAILARLEVQP